MAETESKSGPKEVTDVEAPLGGSASGKMSPAGGDDVHGGHGNSASEGPVSTLGPFPEKMAGWCSSMLFWWANPLFRLGNQRLLQHDDLWTVDPDDSTESMANRFHAAADRCAEKMEGKISVAGVLRMMFTRQMAIAGFMKFWNSMVQFAQPVMLNLVLRFIEEKDAGSDKYDDWEGFLFVGVLVACLGAKALLENGYFWRVARCGFNARTALTAAVYRKSLRLSPAARQASTTGEVVNLMQLDSTRVEMFLFQCHLLWDGLFQIAGYMSVLTVFIGWSAFVGLLLMLLTMPLQAKLLHKMMVLQRRMVTDTDERVKLTNEVLQGIRAIKMYNWEESFVDSVDGVRRRELRRLRKLAVLRSVNTAFMMAAPALVAVAAFTSFATFADGEIKPSTLFAALSTFSQLRFPLMFYPMVLASFAQFRVATRRLDRFLNAPEVDHYAEPLPQGAGAGVEMSGATFYWVNPTTGGIQHNLLSGKPLKPPGAPSQSPSSAASTPKPATPAAAPAGSDAGGSKEAGGGETKEGAEEEGKKAGGEGEGEGEGEGASHVEVSRLLQLLQVAKGKRMVARALPLMDAGQQAAFLPVAMRHLLFFVCSAQPSEEADAADAALSKALADALGACASTQVLVRSLRALLDSQTPHTLPAVLQFKPSSDVIEALLTKGQDECTAAGGAVLQEWMDVFGALHAMAAASRQA